MKLKITEQQYNFLLEYIDEARKQPQPEKLSLFFDDNKNARFFSVISRLKNASEDEYDFKIDSMNGHRIITDINKNTKTKNCSTDARFDTMLYGNSISINFGKCGSLTINNVVGLNIFNTVEDLKRRTPTDSFQVEHEFDKTVEDYVNDYYNTLKKAQMGDEIHIDSKFKYDGVLLEKMNNFLRIELNKAGTKGSFIITIDMSQNPFLNDNESLMFKAKAVKGDGEEFLFEIPIKKFYVDNKSEPEEPEETAPEETAPEAEPEETAPEETTPEVKPEEIEPQEDAKKIMDAILNDPLMKQAFFKQPTLWNLIVSAVKGTNPKGKGILPAKQIISKYRVSKIESVLGDVFRNFSFNRNVSYTLLSKTITFKSDIEGGEPITYNTANNYIAKVMYIGVDDTELSLEDEKTKVKIIINAENKKERRPNTFNVTFRKEYTNPMTKKVEVESFPGLITMESKRGSGYFYYKNKQKNAN